MLLLNETEIRSKYGPSYPMGGARRFNADRASLHRSPTHIHEFGYYGGYTFYAIVQKRVGSFNDAERAALLATYDKAKGEWKVIPNPPPPEGSKPPAYPPIRLEFTPAKDEVNFPRKIYASHQMQGHQVVLWHPVCHMDLAHIIANPLVY